jgi:hypothetical protein
MRFGPNIITEGLVFYADAANPTSYISGSSTVDSLIGDTTGSLINDTYFSSNNKGSWVFDGADDSINLTKITSYSSNDPHSYSAWVKPANTSNTYHWIINNGYSGEGTSLIIFNSKIGFMWKGGGGVDQGITNLNTETWYNLTICYHGSSLEFDMYVNGNLDKSATASSNSPWSAATTNLPRLGTWYNSQWDYSGHISNVQVYNRALPANEVLHNYNALKSRFE